MRGLAVAAVLAMGAAALAGCSFQSGMRFHGSVPESTSEYVGLSGPDDGADIAGYAVQRITPALLTAQTEIALQGVESRANPVLAEKLASYHYLVRPGDVLSIISWNDVGEPGPILPTELAGPSASGLIPLLGAAPSGQSAALPSVGFKVDARGNVFYPYVGTIPAAGKTIDEIRDEIAARAKPLLHNPQITVDVAQYNSQKYTIAGVVVKPGLYPLTDVPLTVSQAIAGAGGVLVLLPTALQNGNTIPRPLGDLSHVLFTHDGEVNLLDIRARMEDNDRTQDRLVSAGDIIQVPDNTFEQIHVIGDVNTPGNFPLDDGKLNLAQALGDAGNMNLTTANFARIFVFRGAYSRRQIFWLDARSPDALLLANRFALEPQDVVYVAATDLAQWNRVISQILPTVQTMYETKVLVGG